MVQRVRSRVDGAELRRLLIAQWDNTMRRWRIPGHLYPFEQALKSGADVVVTSGRLAAAWAQAGLPADRFDDDGADAGKAWLLGADDSLTLIEDHHVADMQQCDFDELVAGTGLRWQVDDAYEAAAVGRHAAWTAAIRGSIGQVRK
jgi:hypothetical protein